MTEREEKLKTSIFFVEATDYEQLMLWERNHKETNWEDELMSFFIHIGNISSHKNKPVNIIVSFVKLYGQRICFYYGCSRFVDHNMIEAYFEENYPVKYDNGTRRAMTDATNFHCAMNRCADK